MACLLQPECNFLHSFFRCKLLVEVLDVEVKITSMQGTHIFRGEWIIQLIKCTPWSPRLFPHPTIIKKIKTFLEVGGRWVQFLLVNSDPHYQIPTLTLERTMPQRKEREQHPGQQPPSQSQCIHPYQRPHLSPKMMYQITDPYLQFQFTRSLHGLAQAKCHATYLNIEAGCSHQIIWTMAMKMKLRMNLKLQQVSQALGPQLKKKKNPKTNDQSTEKCSWGPGCPF